MENRNKVGTDTAYIEIIVPSDPVLMTDLFAHFSSATWKDRGPQGKPFLPRLEMDEYEWLIWRPQQADTQQWQYSPLCAGGLSRGQLGQAIQAMLQEVIPKSFLAKAPFCCLIGPRAPSPQQDQRPGGSLPLPADCQRTWHRKWATLAGAFCLNHLQSWWPGPGDREAQKTYSFFGEWSFLFLRKKTNLVCLFTKTNILASKGMN